MSNQVKRVGLYGGTFDPIHNGHLRVVAELLNRNIVDEIILIPAGQPRLRENAPVADGVTRLEMCKLAISDLPTSLKDRVKASDIEIIRSGPTYAIDTVESLESSAVELFWILGSDAYSKIDNWHRSAELKERVNFIVIERPGTSESEGLDIGALDISATEIRSSAEKGSDQELPGVSPSVRKFISDRKLYAGK